MQQRDMEELMRRISRETGNPDAAKAAGRMRDALNTPEGQKAAQKILEGHSSSLENAARMAQGLSIDGPVRKALIFGYSTKRVVKLMDAL